MRVAQAKTRFVNGAKSAYTIWSTRAKTWIATTSRRPEFNSCNYLCMKQKNVAVLHVLLLIAVAALLCLAGCANQGAQLGMEGKPLSGYVRLTQRQVAYLESYIADGEPGSATGAAKESQFHLPRYAERGRLNVGSGVLDCRGREYRFDVRGLGAAGIGAAKIEAKGEVYGLERLSDFSGDYIQAPQTSTVNARTFIKPYQGLWLKNAHGVIIHLVEKEGAILGPAGDDIVIKMNE